MKTKQGRCRIFFGLKLEVPSTPVTKTIFRPSYGKHHFHAAPRQPHLHRLRQRFSDTAKTGIYKEADEATPEA